MVEEDSSTLKTFTYNNKNFSVRVKKIKIADTDLPVLPLLSDKLIAAMEHADFKNFEDAFQLYAENLKKHSSDRLLIRLKLIIEHFQKRIEVLTSVISADNDKKTLKTLSFENQIAECASILKAARAVKSAIKQQPLIIIPDLPVMSDKLKSAIENFNVYQFNLLFPEYINPLQISLYPKIIKIKNYLDQMEILYAQSIDSTKPEVDRTQCRQTMSNLKEISPIINTIVQA